MVPTQSSSSGSDSNNPTLFGSIDMGTNSLKLLIARPDTSSGRFIRVSVSKEQVQEGMESPSSQQHAITVLRRFQTIQHSCHVSPSNTRVIATSAVRELSNQSNFVHSIHHNLGLQVDVLSGVDEARLIYLGVLQFLPVFDNTILTVDIGGGSTEFVVGYRGEIKYSISLNLGHVTLTKGFLEIESMREHIRRVIYDSDLVSRVKEYNIERVVGSSGTIKHIEKSILNGYGLSLDGSIRVFDEFRQKWCFNKEELNGFVEMLMREESEVGGNLRKEQFFKSRSSNIIAGAILLQEIFSCLGIEEMEVSEYALGEGVIVEKLQQVYGRHRLITNARWQSVVRLATRFNNNTRMEFAAASIGIAKEIFEGLSKWCASCDDCNLESPLIDKDLEYLEAACLLHNIGMYTGKKGYHKKGCNIIMNGDHLHGYANGEIKFIALLVKHHRKKFPKSNALSVEGFSEEVKQKFMILCTVIRLSTILQQYQVISFIRSGDSHVQFKLVLGELRNQPTPVTIRPPSSEEMNLELEKELEHFRQVHHQNLSIVLPPEVS